MNRVGMVWGLFLLRFISCECPSGGYKLGNFETTLQQNQKKIRMSKNLILVSLVLGLLLSSVHATDAVFTYAASTPYCAAPGELTLGVADQQTADGGVVIDFDVISSYFNSNYESVPLMVKNGDGTSVDFKFNSYTNDLADVAVKACTGTATFEFIDLVGPYLLLNNSDTYVVCTYDPAAASIAPVTLVTASLVVGAISQFNPYNFDGTTLYVLVGDGTSSQVVSFDPSTGAGTKVGNPISDGLLTASGNDVFLYDDAHKKFLSYDGSAWAFESVIGSVSGKLLKVTALRQNNLIIDVMSNNKLDSSLYSVSGNTANAAITTITGSTFEVMDFTDGMSDFVHVTSNEMTWLTLPNSASAVLYQSTVTSTQNTKLGDILNVGLSGNKAVVLYSTNKLEYLQHTGANAITVLFSRAYTSGEIVNFNEGSNKQYKLSISCLCAGVDRFACFSATLNCVIIRKAGVTCHQGTDTASSVW